MKEILNRFIQNETLNREEAQKFLTDLATGTYNTSQMAAFLTVYLMRAIRVEELEGFRNAMMDLCLPVNLSEYNTIDVCGTGGDSKNTFNISTASSFVLAGAGAYVAKHGNYGVSSVSGSSDVLNRLGVRFSTDNGQLKKSLDESGICYLHAPLFHPAMKNVATIRKELGVKTFFNMLGPMVNPSSPPNQFIGVFNLELARLYAYLYQKTKKKFAIVHSLEGYDEISLTSPFKIISNTTEGLIAPEDIGMETYKQEDLYGGTTVETAAKILENILSNQGTPAQTQIVLANAGMALALLNKVSYQDGVAQANESLSSEKAFKAFKKFIYINN